MFCTNLQWNIAVSGWNGYCSTNSKYFFFSDSTLACIPRLRTHNRTSDNGRQWVLYCNLIYPCFNIPLVIELFRWMPTLFRSGRISDLWPSSLAHFHGCNILSFPPTGNQGCWILLGKLTVGGITHAKTKTDILTWNKGTWHISKFKVQGYFIRHILNI